MSLDHQTSEAFAPKPGTDLAKDNVVQFDRIFAVQGTNFKERFLGEAVMPVRQDVAVMALQQILAKVPSIHEFDKDTGYLVELAFQIADEFCLKAPTTLDARLLDYFNLYMKRGKIDDILKAAMEAAHDYSV